MLGRHVWVLCCCAYTTHKTRFRDPTFCEWNSCTRRAPTTEEGAFLGTTAAICSGLELQQFGPEAKDFSDPRDAFQGEVLPYFLFARGLEPSPDRGRHRTNLLMEVSFSHSPAHTWYFQTDKKSPFTTRVGVRFMPSEVH